MKQQWLRRVRAKQHRLNKPQQAGTRRRFGLFCLTSTRYRRATNIHRMSAKPVTANSPVPDWTDATIGFLRANLPRTPLEDGVETFGWDHMFSSAYQFGCSALVALGQATETPWGAIQRHPPTLPDPLPRWDDLCCAILALASQHSAISYRCADGSLPPPASRPTAGWIITGTPPPPAPNIAAAHGLGLAYSSDEVIGLLQSLGLIANGHWTAAAVPVFWREQPRAWGMNIAADPRYAAAVVQALDTLPKATRAEIARLTTITEADIAAHLQQHAAARTEHLARFGLKEDLGRVPDATQARRSLEFMRRNDLDWLFFRHWRLVDGWLSPNEAKRALEIFHDPLAIQMRKSVLSQLYPDRPSFAP